MGANHENIKECLRILEEGECSYDNQRQLLKQFAARIDNANQFSSICRGTATIVRRKLKPIIEATNVRGPSLTVLDLLEHAEVLEHGEYKDQYRLHKQTLQDLDDFDEANRSILELARRAQQHFPDRCAEIIRHHEELIEETDAIRRRWVQEARDVFMT